MKTHYFLKGALTMFVLSLFSFQTKADSVVIGGIAYNLVDSTLTAETAKLPNEEKYTGNLVIPASVSSGDKTYAVVKIGDGSLRDAPGLTSVTLPEGLKTIGNSSFASCTGLTSLTIPVTVNSIEEWAFHDCANLASINIPEGITLINQHVFQNSGIKSITLPSSVKTLDVCAFQDASKLTSINLEGITTIADWSLYGTALTSVSIGNVFRIGAHAFRNCLDLTSVTLSESVKIVGSCTFQDCGKLTDINFFNGNGLMTIEDWGFQKIGATSVNLPSSLKVLGTGAFADCPNLTSVVIPKSVTILKDWAFSSTPMAKMYVSWDNPSAVTVSKDAFGNTLGTPTWYVPSDLVTLYGTTWNDLPVSVGKPSRLGTELKVNSAIDNPSAYYSAGLLSLGNLSGSKASVHTIQGTKVTEIRVNGSEEQISIDLPAGVYILNTNNNTSVKFIVR